MLTMFFQCFFNVFSMIVFFPSASNVLSSIPTEIGSISSLRSLRLGRCRSIFLIIQFYSVDILTFDILSTFPDDNMLPSLPSQIGRLVDLEELIFGKIFTTSHLFSSAPFCSNQ